MSGSVFQQLRGSRTKQTKRPKGPNENPDTAAASMKISCKVGGQITGVDLLHLLLLLPFLLFDLLDNEIEDYYIQHGAELANPAHQLIKLVLGQLLGQLLALLEWYHLLRRTGKLLLIWCALKYMEQHLWSFVLLYFLCANVETCSICAVR
jgi:hypothetical protein